MDFTFDNTSPIYLQMAEKLKTAIVAGEFSAGEKLPSVRELAVSGKVNPNTVQKALTELETSGLIFTERTNGKFVTKSAELLQRFKKQYAFELSKKYLEDMQKLGYNEKATREYLKGFGGNDDGIIEMYSSKKELWR